MSLRHLLTASLLSLSMIAPLPDATRAAYDALKAEVEYEFLVGDWQKLLRSIRAGAERTAAISSTRIRRPLSRALHPTQASAQMSSLKSSKHRAPAATRSASARPRSPVNAWYAGL